MSAPESPIMGDARPPHEHLLVILPLPPNEEILNGLKKKHPGLTIKYHQVEFAMIFGSKAHPIPDGMNPSTFSDVLSFN